MSMLSSVEHSTLPWKISIGSEWSKLKVTDISFRIMLEQNQRFGRDIEKHGVAACEACTS